MRRHTSTKELERLQKRRRDFYINEALEFSIPEVTGFANDLIREKEPELPELHVIGAELVIKEGVDQVTGRRWVQDAFLKIIK